MKTALRGLALTVGALGKPIFYGLGEFFYQWHMDATLMSGSFNRPLANDGQIDAVMQVSPGWKAINSVAIENNVGVIRARATTTSQP